MNSIICQHEDPCQSESQTDDHLESENNSADNATCCHSGINSGIKSEETDGTGDCGDTEIAQDILVNFSKKTLTDFNRNESTTWPNRNRNNGDSSENWSNDHPKSEFDDDNDGYSHSSSSNSASDSSEDDSSNSSDSSDDDSEIEMEGTDDKHNEHSNLSEYERLRLRNIQRNEARLAQLGLLVPNSKETSVGVSENTATENDNGESMSNSLTSLLLTNSKSSSSKQKQKQKQRKKKPNHAIVKARSQPRRRAKRSRKRKRANIQKSYFKFHFNTDDDSGSDGDSECSDDSDESSMPSPIRLTKVLLPRGGTTQTIVTESSKATTSEKPYASLPRRSRGRPRREEYVYMCDEVCFHCGGEWKINDGNANNDGNSIDGSCDDGYSELLRCKDCREAFHPHCMMVHGNVDSDCEDITDDCGDIDVPDKNEDCASAADDFDAGIASATNHNGDSSMKNADNSSIVDETCDAAMLLLNMSTMRNSRTSAAASSIEKIGTVLQADCNENGEVSPNSKSDLELVLKSCKEGTRSSSGVADRVDLSISNGSNVLAGVTSKSADCVIYPLRPPKRCSLCKKQRISSQQTEKQLSGCKRNHQNDQGHNHQELDLPLDKRRRQNEPTSPSSILRLNPTPYKQGKLICRDEKGNTNKFIPLLEAMVGDKLVRVKLSPDPSLEAIVNGEHIDCHIIVGQGNALEGEKKLWNNRRTKPGRLVASGNNKHVTWDPDLLSRESGGCINPKANRRTKRKKCSSPVHIAKNSATAKLEKLIGSALRQYDDAKAQELACIALRKLIVSKEAANTIVYLGGINMVATAMLNHTVRPITQAEALATLAEMTWANPSLGTDTIKGGCLSLTLATMGRHEVHFNVQQMAIGYFRALSYDSKCCRLMTKSNVVDIVVRSMRRNPKKLDVLREGSSFLQNMMVVSSTAVKSIVGMNSGRDGHPCIISVIVKAINANCENESLVLSVCGLLANVALHKNGKIALSNAGTAKTLHGILKSSKHADIVQAAMSALYHLVSNNNLLNEDLIKDGYVATIIAAIHVFRNPGIANVSFGLLKELATLKEDMAKEVKNSGAITLAIDAIQNHSDIPELHGNVFSLLEITVSAENKQLHVKIAKRILESMQKHPEEEIIQSDGCRVLASLQKNRALKTLLRTGFGKKTLVLARSVFPDVCGGIIDQLLRD